MFPSSVSAPPERKDASGRQLEQAQEQIRLLEFEADLTREKIESGEQAFSSLLQKVTSLGNWQQPLPQKIELLEALCDSFQAEL